MRARLCFVEDARHFLARHGQLEKSRLVESIRLGESIESKELARTTQGASERHRLYSVWKEQESKLSLNVVTRDGRGTDSIQLAELSPSSSIGDP